MAKSWEVRLPIGIPILGQGFLLSLSLSLLQIKRIAVNYLAQKPQNSPIFDSSVNNFKKNSVINAVKKLFNVTFKNTTRTSVVSGRFTDHFLNLKNAFMGSLASAAGKRGRDERRLEDRIKYLEDGVVQNAIAHRGLMNPAELRVMNPKALIATVAIHVVLQVAVQFKDILLKAAFEFQHICFLAFVSLEFVPSRKKVFCFNNLIK